AASTGYQGEIRFRMMWTYHGVDGSGQPFTVPSQQVEVQNNGYDPKIQIYNTTTGIESYWPYLQNYLSTNGLPASGNSVTIEMTIEQQITNADIYRRITEPRAMGF